MCINKKRVNELDLYLPAPNTWEWMVPLFSIQWPQSDQQSYKLASVAVLCCWVQSVTTMILFEWWEQRQPGCRHSKNGNYYCVPAGLRDIASSSSHLSAVPGVINIPIDAQRVKWLTQGHSKWRGNNELNLKLTNPNMVEMDGSRSV